MGSQNLIITQRSSFFVTHFFQPLLTEKSSKILYVKRNASMFALIREMANNFGVLNTLKIIGFELIFRLIYIRFELSLETEFVHEKNLNHYLIEESVVEKYQNIISVGCPCKIKMCKNRVSIVNLHGGLTPWQKGKFSPIKALRRGDKYLGATIHLIDDEFDSGPVLSQTYISNHFSDNLVAYTAVLKISASLLASFLHGNVTSLPDEVINAMDRSC